RAGRAGAGRPPAAARRPAASGTPAASSPESVGCPSRRVALGVGALQLETVAGTRTVGSQRTAGGVEAAVEEQPFDAIVVVEVLEVAQRAHRAERVRRDLRRAVARQFEAVRLAEAGDLEQPADAAAAGDVRLQAVDGAGLQQVAEVGEYVRVLTRRDVEAAGTPVAQEPQPFE